MPTRSSLLAACCLFLGSTNGDLSPTETQYVAVPSNVTARENLAFITSKPHVAGTAGDFEMAQYVSDKLEEYLGDAATVEIDPLTVLLSYPDEERPEVRMMAPDGTIIFEAALSEDVIEEDSTSGLSCDEDVCHRNHTHHGYAPAGDVTSSIVYANYGRPSDFDELEALGVDVAGKVVLTRYGQCFRGLKAMNAERRGAVAVLVYSDPEDDGPVQGPAYPMGPWRSPSSVQRGSVQYNSLCSGDPARADPRYGETTIESLCGYSTNETLPAIPVLPISFADATPLLTYMGGAAAPTDFIGGIDGLSYTVGPSANLVRVVTHNTFVTTPIPNVIATIPGSLPADEDQPVLLGNHRDAWVFGAADPNSGTAVLLEVARGLGTLLKGGWRPQRTIKLLSWSGEEYGLLGSTGWGELNAEAISRAVVYINVDTAVSGDRLTVAATPSLSSVWEGVMTDLVGSNTFDVVPGNGPTGEFVDANTNRPLGSTPVAKSEIGTLGSGSDYSVFLDHLGIASLDFEFSSKAGTYGVYHSIYDSFDWVDNWGAANDNDQQKSAAFTYMAAAAQIEGVLALRFSDATTLPFNHTAAAIALEGYIAQLRAYNEPDLDLSPLDEAVATYKAAAAATCKDVGALVKSGLGPDNADAVALNERLSLTERRFLAEDGLPSRQVSEGCSG
mmetsp:Transcript_62354/g.171424  ORF Transcript_62354/g.171424 Transcript_62354/m.171424 type:complete len:672 (+) Transcript_62354:32-2047(+)